MSARIIATAMITGLSVSRAHGIIMIVMIASAPWWNAPVMKCVPGSVMRRLNAAVAGMNVAEITNIAMMYIHALGSGATTCGPVT